MFDWFRRKPNPASMASLVGELPVALCGPIAQWATGGDFTPEEISHILEFLPQAIQAMALDRLGFSIARARVSDPNDPMAVMAEQFFANSKAAMLATGIRPSDELCQIWLQQWELTETILSALLTADEYDGPADGPSDRAYRVWKYFADAWVPFNGDEFRANRERASSRHYQVANLGGTIRQAICSV
jgi:hypothetical protein